MFELSSVLDELGDNTMKEQIFQMVIGRLLHEVVKLRETNESLLKEVDELTNRLNGFMDSED